MRIRACGSWFPATKNWKSISGKDWQKSISSLCQTQSWQMSREWNVISFLYLTCNIARRYWPNIKLGSIQYGPYCIWRAREIGSKNYWRLGSMWILINSLKFKPWVNHLTLFELKLSQAIFSNEWRAVGGSSSRNWDWNAYLRRGNGFNFRHKSTENIVWTLDMSFV